MPEISLPTPHFVDCSLPTRRQPILRTMLRDATAADHARLDATLGALNLCKASGYRRFLEINAAALLPPASNTKPIANGPMKPPA